MENSNFNPLDFAGRKILVTGASSGIGRATAIYLSKLGAQIILSGRNEERLNETMLQLVGRNHQILSLDLSKEEELSPFFDQMVQDGIKLNGMVHCAGIPYVMPLQSLNKKRLSDVMETNFFPFIELVRQYVKKKYSSGGSIVCISSILSVQPRAYETGYIASKAAMNAAVTSLAFELAKKEIRINGIIAGNIMTEMVQETLKEYANEENFNKVIEQSLLGLGKPDDIASVCAFLLSDMARFITGRNMYADGGLL
ncbi:SDR family oxidoreductase [Paenibacillus thiaminolyticus]|uniref:SDR family oxidoreductase n=1 Tax=Paenibacillus thiaminolyticus TaxID=49283 RepID=A0AAP9J1Z3_PANTH|nr:MULTISPECIES: SDR family oxidoreductase [Paenibacillus]MCY9534065.1 SDR family oxidoreductase [Paenibacillus thiaminolyticus]MCY9600095.1 SDR family oxidoreductase [Paenibacillus thiaminolyticus]MCY9608461.1 SDR family oxidoreductase [Paenibacillus thiaminolyticus]MCY9615248.1 SDR family oxidoreductase [Paenibacillus thiaminolyticus]MCY9620545.1 SDR family oxidoreductase [Paenibacillus thiaminolyticus]